jgi:hypothetical protein
LRNHIIAAGDFGVEIAAGSRSGEPALCMDKRQNGR